MVVVYDVIIISVVDVVIHNVNAPSIGASNYFFSEWWWSCGQCARLLLWRAEFESCWHLQFFSVNFVLEKNENKQKEAVVGQFFKNNSLFSLMQLLVLN